MRESLCLYGLLLLGLLVARSWGRHEDYYGDCDDDYFVEYLDEYGICDDHGGEGTTETIAETPTTVITPTAAVVCEFPEATPPNATELEASQIALCHVHCIDQYYNDSNFELEVLPGFPNWNIVTRNMLYNNRREVDCPAFLQLLDCRRGCIIQSRSSSSDCVRTCSLDECSFAPPNLEPPCGRECSEDDCDIGCGTVFDIVTDRVNTPEPFPTEINPMAPPSLTQLLDENMQPIARYTVDISGAVLPHRSIRGGFSTLLFQVQNASSGDLYYYWVDEDELNLEAFNHEQVNISFAVVTVEFGTSSYSPSLTLNVEAIDQELGFPEQLTADNISLSYTPSDRTFANFDVTVSWEKPEGFERATGYTVRISSSLSNCGILTDYEVGQTQTSLALESNETIHPFTSNCFYTVQVIVNPMCPSDEIGQQDLVPPLYANTVSDEIRENVTISCPAVFDDMSVRYSVNLTLTFPISQIILESINRFIIRTTVVEELNPMNAIGFLDNPIPIIREDRSRMSYSIPITYAPINLPNTAYNNTVQLVWDSERADSLPITNLRCHVGTLPPEAPGVVMDFTRTEIGIQEIYSNRTRSVTVTVDYTWRNLQLQQTPDATDIDYQVAFVSGSPLLPGASSTGLQIDQYEQGMATGRSIRQFPTDEPIFNAFLQIRARANYPQRVINGDWSDPMIVTVDKFVPPPPQEITNLMVVNSAILNEIFIRESASVLASIHVDFVWAEPVLEFGAIQEYEAWLNFTSLEADEDPETGTHTFDAEERAGTITADFTMAVVDGPATFVLMLQMRSTDEFDGSSTWNTILPITLTTESPPTPDPVSSDVVNITSIIPSLADELDVLVIDIAITLELPDANTLNVTLFQAFVGPAPITNETVETAISGYITDFEAEATSGTVSVVLDLVTLEPTAPPTVVNENDNMTTEGSGSMTRIPRQAENDLLDGMNEMDRFVTLYIQVRARNEFTAGDWSEPLVENITVPTLTPVTTGGNRQSDNATTIGGAIAGVIGGILAIAIVMLLFWLGYRRRQSNKWRNYLEEGDEEEGAGLASIDPRRPSFPLAPLPTDKTPLLLDEWEVSANDVIVEQQLGEGAFGEVFKGAMKGPLLNPKISAALKHTIGLPVAIKLLKTTATGRERSDFLSEIEMMKKIAEGNNRHIVNMIGCVTIQEPLCLILEFVPHGDLLSYIRNRRKRTANKRRKKHRLHLTKPPQPYPSLEPQPQSPPTYLPQESDKAGSPDSQLALLPDTTQDTTQDTTTQDTSQDTPDAQQPPQTQQTDLGDAFKDDFTAPYLEPVGQYSLLDPKPAGSEAVAAEEDEEEEEDPYGELGDLEANDLIQFAYQIATGMEYLASLKIVHRDLACRNILIGEGKKLKITDFGLSREVEEVYVKKTKGRLPLKWMAIECIVDREFTTLSDVWAYGVTLWEVGTLGGFPYPTVPNQDLLNMLKQGYRLEKPDNCAPAVYEIMLECWNEDPQDRPTFPDLRTKFGALLIAGKEDQYIALEVDEMKPYYTVKEEEEDEGRDRRSSSEESIDKIKGKKEEHKELKTKPSNPYVDQPARRALHSQSSQPSLQSQPSQPRGPAVPVRPANTLVDGESFGTDPYFDQLPARPVPIPQPGQAPEEESSLGISIAQLQGQQPSHEGLERRTTNPYVDEPSSVPTSSITHTNGLLETSLTSSLPTVNEIVHAGMNGDVVTDELTGIET